MRIFTFATIIYYNMNKTEINKIMGGLNDYPEVNENRSLFENYYEAFIGNSTRANEDKILEMLRRRLFIPSILPINKNGVLIVGANPSYSEKKGKKDENKNFMKTTEKLYDPEGKHWGEVRKIACISNAHQAAYLDLFPIKQTSLSEFEKVFRQSGDIRARMLQITHKRMLEIKPRVIINYFAMTSYYWGFKANKPDYLDEKNPWMGYKFKKVEADGLDAYQIIGWTDSDASILTNNVKERLAKGTYIIFSTRSWNKEVREKKMVDELKLNRFLKQHDIQL